MFLKSKRKLDTNNVLSIVDKYFCDVLTESGFWEDDNYNILVETIFKFGGIDKENPRAEVQINPKK